MPRRRDVDFDDDRDNSPPRKSAKPGGAPWLLIGVGCGVLFLAAALITVVVAVVIVMSKGRTAGPGPIGQADDKIKQIPGLIAYWSFDEADGNKIVDHSGRGNHATLVGGRLDAGIRGKGLWLDNQVKDHCEIPASNDFNFAANAPFTFADWFKTPLQSAAIISLTSAKGPQQIDMLVRNNRFIVVVGDDLDHNVQNAFVWSNVQNNGDWHHFAFVRRGNSLQLWIDGILQGERAANSSGGAVTTELRAIGCERLWATTNDQRWGNASFQGGIDEVCVFNRALDGGEIQTLAER